MIKLFEWMLYSTILGFWFAFVVVVAVYGALWFTDWINKKRKRK